MKYIPIEREGLWYAVDIEAERELAPVFDCETTAEEVGRKCGDEEAFFQHIPTVPLDTPFPRPVGADRPVHQPARQVRHREPGQPPVDKA